MDTEIDLDTKTQEILLAASNHDLEALKPFLKIPGAASVQDLETGWTPLHAAIGACKIEEGDEEVDMEKARQVVKELFLSGAIWNDLDNKGETPGCLAWRLGCGELYRECVEAGVRAELLLGVMGGYERLGEGSDEEEEEEGEEGEEKGEEVEGEEKPEEGDRGEEQKDVQQNDTTETSTKDKTISQPPKDVNSTDYLSTPLTFTPTTLLDSSSNGVMMTWETPIMEKTVSLIAPTSGLRILNIGYGLGIIDSLFHSTNPSSHHIIEAHPSVLSHLSSLPPTQPFSTHPSSTWQKSPSNPSGKGLIHKGKWQDIVPKLLEQGEVFDVIYFDTFAEDYSELKRFFEEYVVALLDGDGKFSFFNGLGADRRVCYDVYTRVVECDLLDAGFEVEWVDCEVGELGGEGEGEWEGVRRRYWVLEGYRLPVCGFLG